jgi:hypothetical protein
MDERPPSGERHVASRTSSHHGVPGTGPATSAAPSTRRWKTADDP